MGLKQLVSWLMPPITNLQLIFTSPLSVVDRWVARRLRGEFYIWRSNPLRGSLEVPLAVPLAGG